MNPATHAYAELTPDRMLDALSSIDLMGDGRMLALSSYENRVVRLHLDSPPEGVSDVVVAKFYRPNRWSDAAIAEEHAFSMALAQAEVPAVAPTVVQGHTLHHFDGFAFSISPWHGGRRPNLDDFETLEWVGRLMARVHLVGSELAFEVRPALNPETFGRDCRDRLLQGQHLPLEIERTWLAAFEDAMQGVDAAWQSAQAQSIRLHGDCHPGNILWTPDQGPHFVDLDDARMGPAVQDLWMLLSGDRAQCTRQLSAVLDGYEQMRDFDRRELALIEPLRTLRLIHYSAWLASRQDDPAFTHNFPWFGTLAYWQEQVATLQEQTHAMLQPPLFA
jgi:Ser/Thr protein kinase RdoA (MazF antagonist)